MKSLKYLYIFALIGFLFVGCKYDFIVPEEIIDPDDPNAEQVSFADEIVPIFAGKCTSCHQTGGQIPDLTAANAFSSLNSARYINTTTPASSLIYTRANPNNSDSHPKYSEAEAAKVLTWITQGAKNN